MTLTAEKRTTHYSVPDYSVSNNTLADDALSVLIGFAAGFIVTYIFYKIIPISIIFGGIAGFVWIFIGRSNAVTKRKSKLRTQFYDLLESLSVAMRAGNTMYTALKSARQDLLMIYSEDADIVKELDIVTSKFESSVPMSEAFSDFAERSGLEDVASFASVYATIEGKSSRADEIVRETQDIISDKMAIEMEIDTLMTAAKSEVNIMLVMPLVILLVIGSAGGGFMDMIYKPGIGRLVATGVLIVFIACFYMARKFSEIKV
jgi:tight adherence protein B